MSLFKALVFTAVNASIPPTTMEIGPFASQAQCIEAGRVILGPSVRAVQARDDSISGIADMPYVGVVGGDDTRSTAITVRCYEVSPAAH